jgi:hypothetical protein
VGLAKVTRPQIKFVAAVKQANILQIQFDFLDPGDGAVIELLHTSASRWPSAAGTIRGIPQGPVDQGTLYGDAWNDIDASRYRWQKVRVVIIVIAALAIGRYLAILSDGVANGFVAALGVLLALFVADSTVFKRRGFPMSLMCEAVIAGLPRFRQRRAPR